MKGKINLGALQDMVNAMVEQNGRDLEVATVETIGFEPENIALSESLFRVESEANGDCKPQNITGDQWLMIGGQDY